MSQAMYATCKQCGLRYPDTSKYAATREHDLTFCGKRCYLAWWRTANETPEREF